MPWEYASSPCSCITFVTPSPKPEVYMSNNTSSPKELAKEVTIGLTTPTKVPKNTDVDRTKLLHDQRWPCSASHPHYFANYAYIWDIKGILSSTRNPPCGLSLDQFIYVSCRERISFHFQTFIHTLYLSLLILFSFSLFTFHALLSIFIFTIQNLLDFFLSYKKCFFYPLMHCKLGSLKSKT